MKISSLICAGLLYCSQTCSQPRMEDIFTDFVLLANRVALHQDLQQRVIGKTFSLPLDSNSEYRYESACSAIAQFQLTGPEVDLGFDKLFAAYDSLQPDTKRVFLEALYAVAPLRYGPRVEKILTTEVDPSRFSICATYLYQLQPSTEKGNALKIAMVEHFPFADSIETLRALFLFLSRNPARERDKLPDMSAIFFHQRSRGNKVIYSFQNWNRDFPGLAILQLADGHFARGADGKLILVRQLARSAANLPYFLTDGNTPQGIYSIQGLDQGHNHFIGPTPNIQLIMPFENKWEKFFPGSWTPGNDSLQLYLHLLPESWKFYLPMMEAWQAGKIGRTEIIAHGTTIDPEYYKDRPFYPLTPTQGCLCAKEIWNSASGRLIESEQFKLIQAFQSTTGRAGYLFVINVSDAQAPINAETVQAWVDAFEKKL